MPPNQLIIDQPCRNPLRCCRLLVAATRKPDLARPLFGVIDAFKTRFRNQSIGL